MASVTVAELCTLGNPSTPHVIEEDFSFDDKVYTREDAMLIERAGFARTQIMQSTALAGSTNLGDDDAGQLVTIMAGVKAGMQKHLIAERYEAEWFGELDGFLANRCSFHPKSIRRVVETERIVCTKKVFVSSQLCASELIESYLQSRMLSGALNEVDTNFLNQVVLNAFLEANHINIDRHAWAGDYASHDNRVSKMDGFFKIAYNAFNTAKGQALVYTFTGDSTGYAIMGMVGGRKFRYDHDTDIDVTIGKWITYLSGLKKAMSSENLFASVALTGVREVTVTAQAGEYVALNVTLGVGAEGFSTCADGSVTAINEAPSATFGVSYIESQQATACMSPIGVNLTPVNKNNVIQVLEDWYITITEKDSSMLDPAFGGKLMVARNVYYAYKMATHNHNVNNVGVGITGKQQGVLEYMGIRLVPINYMPNDCFMYASPTDLIVAVDLMGDATKFRQWKDQDSDKINFKGALSLGFQIKRVNKVSGTFCDPSGTRLNFQPLMPCSIRRESKMYPVAN